MLFSKKNKKKKFSQVILQLWTCPKFEIHAICEAGKFKSTNSKTCKSSLDIQMPKLDVVTAYVYLFHIAVLDVLDSVFLLFYIRSFLELLLLFLFLFVKKKV